jgi:hypothetical protein
VEIVWRFFFLGSHNNISHLILLQFQHIAAQWSREAIPPSVIAPSLRAGHCDRRDHRIGDPMADLRDRRETGTGPGASGSTGNAVPDSRPAA